LCSKDRDNIRERLIDLSAQVEELARQYLD
jgi:hypothetical protein